MAATSSKVSLKLLINTKTKKVLFAEANKEFVDFLCYILSLPVSTIIRLLNKNSMVGSLGQLYDSIENLSDMYIQSNQSKDSVLNPKTMNCGVNVPLLKHDDDVPVACKFYRCGYGHTSYVTDDPTVECPSCGHKMKSMMRYVQGNGEVEEMAEGGGFVKGVVTYMVMDNLVVKPMSTMSSITILNKFKVKEVGTLQEKVVSLGMKEGLKLLKASLKYKNVLTSVFLARGCRHQFILRKIRKR